MSRTKKGGRPRVKRLDHELERALQGHLTALSALANAYDCGDTIVAAAMSTLIYNIFDTNTKAASTARGVLVFSGPDKLPIEINMAAYHRLIIAKMHYDEHYLTFLPAMEDIDTKWANQPFRTWWDSEPIYIASNAVPGVPLGVMAVDPSKKLEWSERERFTRRHLVKDVRDTVAAHTDPELPALLHDLFRPESFADFEMEGPNGEVLDTIKGNLTVLASPAEAAIRQIAEETLVAYGLRPSFRTRSPSGRSKVEGEDGSGPSFRIVDVAI